MKRSRKPRPLSSTETQKLLGAGTPTNIGRLPTNPLEMRMAPWIVSERLVSRGGRPSDPAWTIVRKVPMRPDTWAQLDRCAKEFQIQNVRVSAGQIAAIVLERGLQTALERSGAPQCTVLGDFPTSQKVRARAHQAHLALKHGALYQCG